MLALLSAALIWAFSFGLIKNRLAGLDGSFVAAARLLVSLLLFAPLTRPRKLPRALGLRLILVGALQYGVMYVAYVNAFRYLKAYEVALLTVLTPVYVTLLHDLLVRRLHGASLLTAALAVLGSAIVCEGGLGEGELLVGALLVQLSNLCFALGQVLYRRWLDPALEVRDHEVFSLLYLGGFGSAGLASAGLTDWRALTLTGSQLLTLLYLGAVASGFAFFLWNHGARRVEVGALAILNNLKIPLAVAVSLVGFGERAPLDRLILGGALLLVALGLHEWLVARQAPGRE
jgi:drug/metabolite transporter (DMT)-like permease